MGERVRSEARATFRRAAGREVNLAAIAEGLCPKHGTALDRRDDCGWCDACGTGWSLVGDTIGVHFAVSSVEIVQAAGGRPEGDPR